MARNRHRPTATMQYVLEPQSIHCWECGTPMWIAYVTQRTVTTTMLSTFRKVTTSYWPGLFHCYELRDLPRTNKELEQYFGSARYHERRATGRKQASPSMVVRGAVRITASVASRLQSFSGADLCPTDLTRWRALRSELTHRQEARRKQHRFRKSPETYLLALEEKLIKERLPT